MSHVREQPPIRVPMLGGVETKADPKTVPAGRLLGLRNGLFTRMGSIAKRHGYDALPTEVLGQSYPYVGTASVGVRGVAARAAELILFTEDKAYSYVDAAGKWNTIGPVASVSQRDEALVKQTSAQTSPDYAEVNGIGLVAWEDSRGGVYFAVVDATTQRVIQVPAQASSTATRPRCVRVGTKLALLWAEAALGQIKIIMFDPSAPEAFDKVLFPSVLVADLVVATPNYDAAYVGPNTGGYNYRNAAAITWNSPTGVRVGWIDPSGVIGSPVTGWGSPATLATPFAPVAGPTIFVSPWFEVNWLVAWGDAVDTRLAKVTAYATPILGSVYATLGAANPSMLALAGHSVSGVGIGLAARADVYVETRVAPIRNSRVAHYSVNLSTAAVTLERTVRGAVLASKAWEDLPRDYVNADQHKSPSSYAYVTLGHDVPLFGVYMTMRSDGAVVARTLPGVAGDAPPRAHLPSACGGGSTPNGTLASSTAAARVYKWPATYKEILESENGDQFTEAGIRLVTLDFESAASHQTAMMGRSIYLGGACPLVYDGISFIEANFHYGIDWDAGEVLHVNSNTGGGGLTAGTRGYIFVPEYTLATGEILRGPASDVYEVTLAGAEDETTLNVPTIRVTRMTTIGASGRTEIRIGVFRSKAGDATAYYRVSSLDPSAAGDNGYLSNSTIDDSVPFVDVLSDADLALREPLYTNGGILSNDPAQTTEVLAVAKNRLWSTDPSDGSTVRFSQERIDGEVVQFPPELNIPVDPYGGDVTAIATLDDAVIVFKRSAIYAVIGAGPLGNPEAGGPADGFSAPALVTSDVGCVSQRSIASTPIGVVFQSAKGIYLLDRSRQVSYIGAPVEAYNAQTIVRATLIEDATQIRFLTSSGLTLMYDYHFNQWATWTNHEGIDAALVGGVYHYIRNDGRVFQEDAASYDDDGHAIKLRIETAWIRWQEQLLGLQKFWHLHLIGAWLSAHKLSVQVAMDYATDGDWSTPIEIDCTTMGGSVYGAGVYGAGAYGGTPNDIYAHRIHLGEKGAAIRFAFEDVEAAGSYGAAYELTELVVTGGIIGPVTRPFRSSRTK